mmetsp:Transcript_26277/g.65311  ORF Transcript_26277/g.65311 Transcript_26277/m.65311 type:complete len:319 (-) Transcript_26277:512-1468(-)
MLVCRDGPRLEDVLVDADKTDGVAAGNILHLFDVSAHHEYGSLDVLDDEVLLAARHIVWALDADLLTRRYRAREHATEGVEPTLVRRRHHLGHVHHQRAVRVAIPDAVCGLVVHGSLVEIGDAVLLCHHGRRQVGHDHRQQRVASVDPHLHHTLQQRLARQLFVLRFEVDSQLVEHLGVLVLVVVHDAGEELADGVHDELAECATESGAFGLRALDPLLGLAVEVIVAPQTLHHLFLLDPEFLGVYLGEQLDREGPTVQTRTETHGTLLRVDLDISHELVLVGGDHHIDVLNRPLERLEDFLSVHLEFEECSVDFVDV